MSKNGDGDDDDNKCLNLVMVMIMVMVNDGDDYNCGLNMGWVTGGRWYRGCKELTLRIIWGR